ncbi:hypothetical protein D3C81_805940 [compost metagenome]
MHLGAHAFDTVQAQRALHQFGQRAADHQPQAGALACPRAVGMSEGVEQPGLVFGADTNAAVAHAQLDLQVAVAVGQRQGQAGMHFTALGELDGVADQVGEHLLESQGVCQDPGRRGWQRAVQVQAFDSRIAFEYPQRVAHQFDQVGRYRLQGHVPGLDARDVEDVADQLQQADGRIVGSLQCLGIAAAGAAVLQGQFQQADHRIHRGTDFMAHGCQESALGLAGLFGIVLGLAQLFEQAAAQGQLGLQGVLGFGALVDQFAQVAVPENHPGQQQGRQHQYLQRQGAVVAPGAVADQCAGAPAVDQLVQFFWRDAQQRLVENGLQLRLVRGYGECRDGRAVVQHTGDTQPVLEYMVDVVGGVDVVAQCNVGGAIGHRLHEPEGVVHFHHFGVRVAAHEFCLLRRAANQGYALAVEGFGLRR